MCWISRGKSSWGEFLRQEFLRSTGRMLAEQRNFIKTRRLMSWISTVGPVEKRNITICYRHQRRRSWWSRRCSSGLNHESSRFNHRESSKVRNRGRRRHRFCHRFCFRRDFWHDLRFFVQCSCRRWGSRSRRWCHFCFGFNLSGSRFGRLLLFEEYHAVGNDVGDVVPRGRFPTW